MVYQPSKTKESRFACRVAEHVMHGDEGEDRIQAGRQRALARRRVRAARRTRAGRAQWAWATTATPQRHAKRREGTNPSFRSHPFVAGAAAVAYVAAAASQWLSRHDDESLLLLHRWWRSSAGGAAAVLARLWDAARAAAVAPVLAAASWACLVLSAMLLADALFLAASWASRLDGCGEDEEGGRAGYPMVLVQIPMYNEREMYKLSIGAACGLSWPSDRVIVQVLDDSTDPTVKDLVELECKSWANKGKNVKYEVRSNRKGYKAGALKQGMMYDYVQQCEFVAVFDADFQPEPDFLLRTIPYFVHKPQIALIQARWEFGTC